MPNHTTNILTITGPRPELERFMMTVSSDNPALQARKRAELEARIASAKAETLKDPKSWAAIQDLPRAEKSLQELNDGKLEVTLDFDGTVPQPLEYATIFDPHSEEEKAISAECLRKYGSASGYDWNIANYGTKWGAYDVEPVIDEGDTITYNYQTAWSPPEAWLTTTSGLFPELTFINAAKDEGGGFYLRCTYEKGECTEQLEYGEHEWMSEYDENYSEEYAQLFEGAYSENIKFALEHNPLEYYSMEEPFLEQIKDEDLPLFVNFEWNDDSIGELYAERVKNAETVG